MKWIKAEGVNFKYIFPNDDIMKEEGELFRTNITLLGEKINPSFDFYKTLQSGVNTRLAIFKNYRLKTLRGDYIPLYDTPYCIIWPDDVNLTELDKKVANGCFSDEDFSRSIRARMVKIVLCRNCRAEYMGLVVDSSEVYTVETEKTNFDYRLGSELLDKKIKNYKFKKCPNCNSPFTIYVAKIFYECEDKKFIW
ncbi:hypothetical protein A9G42_07390 [Gilliamella sp. Nev6-6]|uniref:hypothetical protein n=1 Tax=unclassified Gilliamella TaxID=2685620 RepID=UPI00080E8B4D|nr:hypothetical protein [Gilliamella apicola]OCG57201.1 hypothetical protein A9G40_13420 [Gilliamella apicola]OCG68836.1 hypothetical protein A9G41_00470 [Gilliamella apicola]OCG76685.1 hypothetical protein A9G42_07390 [Gilliamella apicola]